MEQKQKHWQENRLKMLGVEKGEQEVTVKHSKKL